MARNSIIAPYGNPDDGKGHGTTCHCTCGCGTFLAFGEGVTVPPSPKCPDCADNTCGGLN